MERSEVIARAAAELRERAGSQDEMPPAGIAWQSKADDLVLQLCRLLKLRRTDAGSGSGEPDSSGVDFDFDIGSAQCRGYFSIQFDSHRQPGRQHIRAV